MDDHGILLESGTNEVEIAVVTLGDQQFGINVAKIREFKAMKGLEISPLPGSHQSVQGVFDFREDTVPLIDLGRHLGLQAENMDATAIIVVTEFNNTIAGFLTDGITDIHRISWTGFRPLNRSLAINTHHVIGSVGIEDHRVLVLDMEQILGEIYPESVINYDEQTFSDRPVMADREQARIFFADDSTVIRNQVTKILNQVGYSNVRTFIDGQAALDAMKEAKKRADSLGIPEQNMVTLLLSDIEMPKMDGLSLCREVRESLGMKIPVIMFSSLINEQMAEKCQKVGANAFVSKPETQRLLDLIDGYCCPSCAPTPGGMD